ncbi:MAG: hypothetical protein LCH63_16275 [Candidatus Melainabacteria bacterium]|nr:hypothetical protein [Candidatus Melainabacteria bacterium]
MNTVKIRAAQTFQLGLRDRPGFCLPGAHRKQERRQELRQEPRQELRQEPRQELRQEPRQGRRQGSSIAEFGPAFFFLFIFAVFPVLDIIGLGFGYVSSISLNDLQLRQAVKVPRSEAEDKNGSVKLLIPKKYVSTLAGGLASITQLPSTQVIYESGPGGIFVTVTTQVTVSPFLTIPFFSSVPGLGAPATYTVSSTRLLENPRFYAN